MHLFLIGYRGTGKTTVGNSLAAKVHLAFVDLDQRIESRCQCTIKELFDREGEAGFRDSESQALADAAQESDSIISLGGGAIIRESNRQLMKASGRTVWLRADVATIAQRLSTDPKTDTQRPALTTFSKQEDEIASVLSQREPIYRQAADWIVDTTDESIDSIVDRVANWWTDVDSPAP